MNVPKHGGRENSCRCERAHSQRQGYLRESEVNLTLSLACEEQGSQESKG